MALLMPIVVSRSQYRLANGNTKYDNHGGGQAVLLTRIMGRCAEDGERGRGNNIIIIIINELDQLCRPDEITEKTRIKGITELSNILTG